MTAPGTRGPLATVGAIGLLTAALPASLALTAAALLRGALVPAPREVAERPLTVLVSGGKMTKSLQLARSFHRAGHRVVMVETAKYRFTGHRASRAVDRFHVVPEPTSPDYAAALLRVVQAEGVDVYVPVCSPVASVHDADAAALLAGHCEVLHVDSETVRRLDDKQDFADLATSLGLSVPESRRVTAPEQVLDVELSAAGRPFVLKSIPYDPVHRLDLTPLPRPTRAETEAFVLDLPISPEQPWVLQELITGTEFCTHSTVRDGQVQLHVCCPSSAFLVNYAPADEPEVEAWVRAFVGALGLTGQVSFDVIKADDGTVYPLECNPRTHTAITLFGDRPDVARAYLETGVPTVVPGASARPTYWVAHELWRLATEPSLERLRVLARGRDAVFAWSDPLPFLLHHHRQVPWLLLQSLLHGRRWVKIDFNIGKLVEAAGD